ncbi:PolC-type DNA polymerase III [Spiroplasma endosymbiont of Othius punctulatus]|uniref:PolC-type DNA polymerase III n=1 Tax=Spiroplasma endosymbiont of Othius punctulatus TaxID=3066289 RepID=UPI0030D0AB06
MKDRVSHLFKKLNIELSPEQTKLLEGADFFKPRQLEEEKNRIRIFISVKETLPIELIKVLEDQFENNKRQIPIKVNFQPNNIKYEFDVIWEYVEYLINHKSKLKAGVIKLISKDKFKFNPETNQVTFEVTNQTQVEELAKETSYFEKRFSKYGFKNIDVEFKIGESEVDARKRLELKNKDIVSQLNKNKYNPETFKSRIGKPNYKSISEIEEGVKNVVINGELLKKEARVSKAGNNFYIFSIGDETSAIKCINFTRSNIPTALDEEAKAKTVIGKDDIINVGDWISARGNYEYSTFDKSFQFIVNEYQKIPKIENKIIDDAEVKRVELHTHSKMSVMDGVSSIEEYLSQAKDWGWNAIALTDHQNIQAYPAAFNHLNKINKGSKNPLKLIYGCELAVIDDSFWYVNNPKKQSIRNSRIVIFDLETTGLSPERDEIIEFGAVIYEPTSDKPSKEISILIKPKSKISEFTTSLTNITNDMLEDKNKIEVEFKKIYDLIGDSILIAHNAKFDMGFLNSWAIKLGYKPFDNTVIDTLAIARAVKPRIKNHRLGTVCKSFGILYDDNTAHRADYDARVLSDLYDHLIHDAKKMIKLETVDDWEKLKTVQGSILNLSKPRPTHVNVLAKNQAGLKVLFKMISHSHVEGFLGSPKITETKLFEFQKMGNILVGAGCLNSPVFEAARTKTNVELENEIKKYDYIEIQPLSVYSKFIQIGDLKIDELKEIQKLMIKLAIKNNVKVVATSDAHYVKQSQKQIRDIYIQTKGLAGVAHPLFDYKNRVKTNPDQHMRTTNEMLKEFEWIGDKKLINDIVIKNTNDIADMIDMDVKPLRHGLFTPKIDNVDKLLTDECYSTAKSMYGDELPTIVKERIEKELQSIIKHGFAVVYWISHLLVKQSLADSYLVGSRGSVGSSFAATMSNITEVNPLRAHYRCAGCKYSDFETNPEIKCGYDLPKANCPKCNKELIGDGHDIPFETFLGFNGDKVPDIDLNFSGDYQPTAHNFTKKIFGDKNVFRAGTISTVADKTAYGYVKGYLERKELQMNSAQIDRLASESAGVKRTTGQHPGGIIVLPKEYDIEDFTPVNYPADDSESPWLTTHFDFHAIHDNLLKLDILGHDDPTALKMLYDITGVDPQTIPTNSPEVYSLFSNQKALGGVSPEQLNGEVNGALGLPEFGTGFVRKMLNETKPKTFSDLVQISGLSHGTDVYVGNAQELISSGKATISTVIGCRDDIMVYLMSMGLDSSLSFTIMESVRKGKGLTSEWISEMKAHDVPTWYIESCIKIKYMFPKAHATAYVLMAYRVAWYKINFPIEYYATWFTTRAKSFDLETAIKGEEFARKKYAEIIEKQENRTSTQREDWLINTLEVMFEMYARGIEIKNISFSISEAEKFVIKKEEDGKQFIYPPFTAIDSLGEAVARKIIESRNEKSFSSLKDLENRTNINKTHLQLLKDFKIIDSLKDEEQITFGF